MQIKTYVNKRNEHKFLNVKKTKCYHYYIQPFMHWEENGVTNYFGVGYNPRLKKTRFGKISKRTLNEILTDYVEVK